MTGRDILIHLSTLNDGNWDRIYADIKKKRPITEDDVKDSVAKLKCKAVTILDEEYPEFLKSISRPPFVLFYYGDLSLAGTNENAIAVIGSRRSSKYGERITNVITSDLAKKLTIVSGLAIGIDTCAHQACLNVGGKTIAILGSGIDNCYPKRNRIIYEEIKTNHLLISEYPAMCEPKRDNFPMRNRLIAAFARAVLVTEAYSHSGTSLTVSFALTYGRDVLAVPYEAGRDSACNLLIRDGARLTESAADVFDELGIR